MAAKDQPLFGPVDQVINTLELEIRLVKDLILAAKKTIARKEEDIEILDERLKNLVESMATVRKDRPKTPAKK